jgi:hypothetical protein
MSQACPRRAPQSPIATCLRCRRRSRGLSCETREPRLTDRTGPGGAMEQHPALAAAGSRLTCVVGGVCGDPSPDLVPEHPVQVPDRRPGSRCCCPHALTDWSRDPASEQRSRSKRRLCGAPGHHHRVPPHPRTPNATTPPTRDSSPDSGSLTGCSAAARRHDRAARRCGGGCCRLGSWC